VHKIVINYLLKGIKPTK